jgi:hypothetical protein
MATGLLKLAHVSAGLNNPSYPVGTDLLGLFQKIEPTRQDDWISS